MNGRLPTAALRFAFSLSRANAVDSFSARRDALEVGLEVVALAHFLHLAEPLGLEALLVAHVESQEGEGKQEDEENDAGDGAAAEAGGFLLLVDAATRVHSQQVILAVARVAEAHNEGVGVVLVDYVVQLAVGVQG